MKKLFFTVMALVVGTLLTQAQPAGLMHLRKRAETNLSYLLPPVNPQSRVLIDQAGVHFRDVKGDMEFTAHWTEVSKINAFIEDNDYPKVVQWYKNKRNNHSAVNDRAYNYYREYPSEIKELRVALDPGHFGGELEKDIEHREVVMKKADLNSDKDAVFNEADLNYFTCLLIRDKLIAKGVPEFNIIVTRSKDAGAIGVSYPDFLKSISKYISQGQEQWWLEKAQADTLRKYANAKDGASYQGALFNFYRNSDFRARGQIINGFNPHVTYIIHYNASDTGKPDKAGFLHPTDQNFNCAFVPGAFNLAYELSKTDQKVDFLRLLISPDLDNSMRLANMVVKRQSEILNVPVLPFDSLGAKLRAVSLKTPYEGVFARNLYLSRCVRGTVVYGESLYQDNIKEAVALSKKEVKVYDFRDASGKTYMVPKRCEEVAEAYVQGVLDYLAENKAINEKVKPAN